MREIKKGENNEAKNYIKPEINFLPVNLDLDEWLKSQKFKIFKGFRRDSCVKLLSNMYTIPLYNKSLRDDSNIKDNRKYYNLSSEIMEKSVRNYKSYVNLFLDGGIWECDNTYSKGNKSKGYRFTSTFTGKPCKSYLNYSYTTDKKIDRRLSETIDGCKDYSPTVNTLVDYLGCIELDYSLAIEQIDNNLATEDINVDSYNSAFCALEMIENEQYFAKQDEYGRLHTNITNLKKECRPFIKVNGNGLVSLDLKNSQPFFSTLILNSEFWENSDEEINKITVDNIKFNIKDRVDIHSIIMFLKSAEHNDDLLLYKEFVINGSLYEYFQDCLLAIGIKCKSRADAKTRIFQILFSMEMHLANNKSALLFKSIFPSVYELFRLIKQSEHNTLSILLQSIEGQIFLEGIAGNFIKNNPDIPIYTIHDSVLVPIAKADGLDVEMINYIEEMTGYKPSIEVEILN